MAYGLKYYALSVDRNDLHWELDIYQEGYVGSGVTELRGASPAFSLIYEGENDDLFSKQILPSRLEARLIAQDDTFLLEVEGIGEKGITEIEDAGKLHKLKYSLYEDIEFNKPYKVAKKINCPVFIVHGDHDTCVPVTQSRKFAGLVKNGRLHEIKGADHWFPEGPQRTEMVEKVYEFITNKVK